MAKLIRYFKEFIEFEVFAYLARQRYEFNLSFLNWSCKLSFGAHLKSLTIRFLTVFFFFLGGFAYSQENTDVLKYKKKLTDINSEIGQLETKLKKIKESKKRSITEIELIDRQSFNLDKILLEIKQEEILKETQIKDYESKINEINSDIYKIKDAYSRYIKWFYKYGRSGELDFVFSSETLTQALIRYKNLKVVTSGNQQKINKMLANKDTLKKIAVLLENEKEKKRLIAQDKEKEQSKLQAKAEEKKKLINEFKKNEEKINDEIRKKRLLETQIKDLVYSVIEDERKRVEDYRKRKLSGEKINIPERFNYSGFEDFTNLRGKLIWPIANGKIIRDFGDNENSKLKTITKNYGIDIKCKLNDEVKAIADGFISVISWIPGYGSIVIISHKNGYRTVYGHIKNINVKIDQPVKKGTVLGLVNESLEGSVLHFELWNERNYHDPKEWLTIK